MSLWWGMSLRWGCLGGGVLAMILLYVWDVRLCLRYSVYIQVAGNAGYFLKNNFGIFGKLTSEAHFRS